MLRCVLVALCLGPLAVPLVVLADDYYIQWTDTIDNGDWDGALGAAVDDSGNIIVTGCSFISGNSDYFTVQYDPHGTILWHDALDNGDNDFAQAIAVDNANSMIVTGYSHIQGDYDYFTAKYTSSGHMSWADTLDNRGLYDIARGVATDNAGNIIVTGYCDIGGDCVYLTVKYDSAGAIVWSDTLDNGRFDSAFGIAVDQANSIIVTGYTSTGINNDYFTVAYDSSGTILWHDTIDNRQYDQAYAVAVDRSSNVVVTGCSGEASSDYDYLTVKYDAKGTVLWEDILDNAGHDDVAYGVAVDDADNIIVTGSSAKLLGDYDYFTVKYDPNGKILWQDTVDNGSDDMAHGVAVDARDNIIVTGKSYIGGSFDYYTVKYAPDVGGSGDERCDGGGESWSGAEVYPNPFHDRLQIQLEMGSGRIQGNEEEEIAVRIATAGGRVVRSLRIERGADGEYPSKRITWDGRDGRGERVPSGVYFVSFGARDLMGTEKVLLLR